MTITAILEQPESLALMAAFRPIKFLVRSAGIVPPGQPAYCDVYLSGVFYRTLSAYSYERTHAGADNYSIFEFDIQDALQDFLTIYPFAFPPDAVTRVAGVLDANNVHICACYCKFRGSTIDDDGILTPEATVPVQGTDTSDPVAGTGTLSHTFHVLKATLRTLDNPSLQTHLDNLRIPVRYIGSDYEYFSVWPMSNIPYNPTKKAYPFTTELPGPTDRADRAVDVYFGDSGWFPVYIPSGLPSGCVLGIQFYRAESSTFYAVNDIYEFPGAIAPGIYYLPFGHVDIARILGGMLSRLKKTVENPYYRIVIYRTGEDPICFFVSPMFHSLAKGYQNRRLWFQNNFGMFEQLSFNRAETSFKTTSKTGRNILSIGAGSPGATLGKLSFDKRQTVESQHTYEAMAIFSETMMPYVQELLASSIVMMDMSDPEEAISSDSRPALVPVVIVDATADVLKSEERYQYMVTIKYTNSITNINIRN